MTHRMCACVLHPFAHRNCSVCVGPWSELVWWRWVWLKWCSYAKRTPWAHTGSTTTAAWTVGASGKDTHIQWLIRLWVLFYMQVQVLVPNLVSTGVPITFRKNCTATGTYVISSLSPPLVLTESCRWSFSHVTSHSQFYCVLYACVCNVQCHFV